MNGGSASAAVQYLRTLFEAESVIGFSDGELLDRFVSRREAACLEALVQRHGPMVWGVCRRLLRDHHDAEDAYQATFLVLVRRAASILPREKVGNWLYGVAHQTALKARATRAKRRLREAAAVPEPETAQTQSNLAELLDQELSRLPDKYRTPIVLCELQGKSHGEAAEQLGWPIGTVSGRLSRARALLAKRLARRGALATGVSLAALLTEVQATATAPATLLASTVQAATQFAIGNAAGISAEVLALTKEVIRSMYFSKLKTKSAIAAATLLLFTLTGAGIWQASSLADAKTPAAENFHVSVNEVLQDDSTLVAQIDIDVPPGTTIDLSINEKDKNANSQSLSTSLNDPNQVGGLSRVRFTVLADQVESKEGPTNAYKFLLAYKVGKISGSSSEARLMPAGAKHLSDLLTMSIKSGDYKIGMPVKFLTFRDTTYSIVVNHPK